MNTKCQVFTPNDYVNRLLNSVGYHHNLYGRKILENSCGDGNVLLVVVQRYIDDCRTQGLTDAQIKLGLENDIFGVEIDPVQHKKCIANLNRLTKKNGLKSVKWKVINQDYLRWKEPCRFQYVVGNPPYITYQELKEEDRIFVREKYETCKNGKFDYCYAFIEKSIESLDIDGQMAYLIPSSIFKTVFGESLREYMKPCVRSIQDYTLDKVFDGALVKSAIITLDKARANEVLQYQNMTDGQIRNIPVKELSSKWFFGANKTNGKKKFGDYFKVSHAVATLYNKAFVMKHDTYKESEDYYECEDGRIEKALVRETATPRSLRYDKHEKIIFPYDYVDGELISYTEEEFGEKFPEGKAYLERFRDKLDKRKSDHKTLWFEYGRSQALAKLNRTKLLMSTVITNEVTTYMLDSECIPYAGLYIFPKEQDEMLGLERAKEILESDSFREYVESVGIHISGVSVRITSKDIENYMF